MWGLRFCSTERERSIVRSIYGKMAEDKKNRRYVFFAEPYTFVISIYTLSDLGVLSNLIGSLSLANEHYSPPIE